MRDWIIVCFFAMLNFKGIKSVRDLPTGAKIVQTCPAANNKTAWELASKGLGCSLFGKISRNKKLYHCLPSSSLNEYVEFCGFTAPMDPGYCPVFHYVNTSGKNSAPSYLNCSTFSSGCPREFYFSRDVYKYPECLDIDISHGCFRADNNCTTDMNSTSQTEYETPKSNKNDIKVWLVWFLTGLIIFCATLICGLVAYIFKMKRFPRRRKIEKKFDNEGIDALSLMEALKKRDEEEKEGIDALSLMEALKERDEEEKEETTYIEMIGSSVNPLLAEIARQIPEEKIPQLKYLLEYSTRVSVKLATDIDKINLEDLTNIMKHLQILLSCKPTDIRIKGIAEGCVLLSLDVKNTLLETLRKCDFSSMRKHKVFKISIMNECIFYCRNLDDNFHKKGHFTENLTESIFNWLSCLKRTTLKICEICQRKHSESSSIFRGVKVEHIVCANKNNETDFVSKDQDSLSIFTGVKVEHDVCSRKMNERQPVSEENQDEEICENEASKQTTVDSMNIVLLESCTETMEDSMNLESHKSSLSISRGVKEKHDVYASKMKETQSVSVENQDIPEPGVRIDNSPMKLNMSLYSGTSTKKICKNESSKQTTVDSINIGPLESCTETIEDSMYPESQNGSLWISRGVKEKHDVYASKMKETQSVSVENQDKEKRKNEASKQTTVDSMNIEPLESCTETMEGSMSQKSHNDKEICKNEASKQMTVDYMIIEPLESSTETKEDLMYPESNDGSVSIFSGVKVDHDVCTCKIQETQFVSKIGQGIVNHRNEDHQRNIIKDSHALKCFIRINDDGLPNDFSVQEQVEILVRRDGDHEMDDRDSVEKCSREVLFDGLLRDVEVEVRIDNDSDSGVNVAGKGIKGFGTRSIMSKKIGSSQV
ncbi:uncharacterized protein LOC134272207 [Saccostrea cucullata]|uniref:uncharacterized protein LOC134272207 n=1 Tax=Saccostrea cuccullata TaxID=36930 RepID=UPI002ED09CA0